MSFIDSIDKSEIADSSISDIAIYEYYSFVVKGSGLSAELCNEKRDVSDLDKDCIEIKIDDELVNVLKCLTRILPKDITVDFIAISSRHVSFNGCYAFTTFIPKCIKEAKTDRNDDASTPSSSIRKSGKECQRALSEASNLETSSIRKSDKPLLITESMLYNWRFRQFVLNNVNYDRSLLPVVYNAPKQHNQNFQTFPTFQSIADLFFFHSEVSEICGWWKDPSGMEIDAEKAKLIHIKDNDIEYPEFDKSVFCDFVRHSSKRYNWKCRVTVPQGNVFDIYFAIDIRNIEAMALCYPR